MPIVLVTILLPLVAGGLLFALPRLSTPLRTGYLDRALGTLVALATLGMLIVGRNAEWSVRWLSRPFHAAFHFGATPLGFWICLLYTSPSPRDA